MAIQGGMSKEDFIARVEISMVMQRPLENCVHLRVWERITDQEVTWYLVTGQQVYFNRHREDFAADETASTMDLNETVVTEDLYETLEATMEEARDETFVPVPDLESGAASRGEKAERGAIPKRRPDQVSVAPPRDQKTTVMKTSGECEKEEPKLSKGQKAKRRKEEWQRKEEMKRKEMEKKLEEAEQDRREAEERLLMERKAREEERKKEEERLKEFEVEVAKREKKAKEDAEQVRRLARSKRAQDELTKDTAKELTEKLIKVDFTKYETLNAVEGNVFHPLTKEQAQLIQKNWMIYAGVDPCKSCEPRKKISAELKARMEHVKLKKKMRTDEIKRLELEERKEEKRKYDQMRCSLKN